MKISFSKYQGTGNDFVMLDNLDGKYNLLSIDQIQTICDRRFGVGADGLIKINSNDQSDFEVDYYNSDGSKSFCGNGARCSVAFAETLGIDVSKTDFIGIDGLHNASKIDDIISLEMMNVSEVKKVNSDFIVFTGSPHYIRFTNSIESIDIVQFGKEIRYSEEYKENGINVNLVEIKSLNELIVNTYERGVEDETLSCGTGVTACVLAYGFERSLLGFNTIEVKVKGGILKVSFNQVEKGVFENILLIGPGEFVFQGEINV
jgi:diaminopimelate epimerase